MPSSATCCPPSCSGPLRERVFDNARQRPTFGVIADAGDENGEAVLINLEAKPCVEGTDGCRNEAFDPAELAPTWKVDWGSRAFSNPLELRKRRRTVSGALFVGFAAASVVSQVVASNRRGDWTERWEACVDQPVIPTNCNDRLDRDAAETGVDILNGLTYGPSGHWRLAQE